MVFLRSCLIIFCLFLAPFYLKAEPSSPLKVGIFLESPPFSYRDKNGAYVGAAVGIFKHIAKELKWSYEFIPLKPDFNEGTRRLAQGEFDLLIGAMSITYERYKLVDFSFPFFLNHMGVAVKKPGKEFIFKEIIRSLKEKIGYFFPIMIFLFLMVMFFLYLVEGKKRTHEEKKNVVSRIGKAFWETLMVFIQGHSVSLISSTILLKRIILLFWLLPSLVFFSIILGSIVSTLTLIENHRSALLLLNKEELEGKKVAVFSGSVSVDDARKVGAIPIPVSSNEEIIKLIEEEKVFGVIGDYAWLEAVAQQAESSLVIANLNLRNDEEAFAFKKGSPLLPAFNQKLIYLQSEGFAENICSHHLGKNANLCVL